MYIKELTNNEFKLFTRRFKPSSIYQTAAYAFTMNEQDSSTVFLGLIDNNEIKAASLILIKKVNGFNYAYAPRGFLIDYNDFALVEIFTNEIKKFLGKHDIVAVKINPIIIRYVYDSNYNVLKQNIYYDSIFSHLKSIGYHHLGYNDFFEALKPRFEAIINLNKKANELFFNIDKSFRTKIRSAENMGIKVYRGDESNLEYLYLQTKNKYPRDLKYFKDLYSFFHKDNLIDFYYSKLDTHIYLEKVQKTYEEYEGKVQKLNDELIHSVGKNNAKLLNEKIKLHKAFQKCKKRLNEALDFIQKFPDGIVLSSALVVRFNGEVYVIMDGYNNKYKNFNAKHLLMWKLIGNYSNLGYQTLNLGGIINTKHADKYKEITNKYKGLNEFKMKFGAEATEYIGDLELITNTALYFMYANAKPFRNIFKK